MRSYKYTLNPVIHIIDDDDLLRGVIGEILSDMSYDVQTYSHAHGFLGENDLPDLRCGCIISDIRMPNMSGLQLQKRLNEKECVLPLIFLTGYADVEMTMQAMREGAFDFFQKPFRNQMLFDRVASAVSLSIANYQKIERLASLSEYYHELSNRECEVLNYVARGFINKKIAVKLKISSKTVEFHRANIMKKFHAQSLAELIIKAMTVDPTLSPLSSPVGNASIFRRL